MKKRMVSLLIILSLAFLIGIPASAVSTEEKAENTFHINVSNAQGAPLDAATVSLYSYLDTGIVLSGETGADGSCTLYYDPDIVYGENEDVAYADYVVYVAKEGYQDNVYYLTKIFSRDGACETDEIINGEEINVQLDSESPLAQQAEMTSYQNDVYSYLYSSGKLSDSNPFYIIQDEDRAEMERLGIMPSVEEQAVSTTPITNVDVPIGEFHVVKGGRVKVVFSSTDSIKVETKVKASSSSGWTVSGSVSKKLDTLTTNSYPDLTTTTSSGIYKKYFVRGDFVKEESYTTGGGTRTTIRLDQLRGGAYTGGGNCDVCKMAYNSAYNGSFGLATPINKGGSVAKYESTTTNLGLYASAGGASLGVTRVTGASTNITYFADSANIVLYDYNTSGRVLHMTAQS